MFHEVAAKTELMNTESLQLQEIQGSLEPLVVTFHQHFNA